MVYGFVIGVLCLLGIVLSRLNLVFGEWALGKSLRSLSERYGDEFLADGLDSGRELDSYVWSWSNIWPRSTGLRDRLMVLGSDIVMVLGVLMVYEAYASSGSYWLASSAFVLAMSLGISYVTDVKERYIFNWTTFPGIVYIGFVSVLYGDQVWWSYIGAGGLVIVMIVLSMLIARKMMGFGDIFLYVLVGMYVGLLGIVPVILLSAVLGALYGFVLMYKRGKSEHFAFGPFIVLATLLVVLFGITM